MDDLREFSTLNRAGTRIVRRKDCEKMRELLVEATSFLNHDVGFNQRLWHVKHDTYHFPLCSECNSNQVTYDPKTLCSYRDLCSDCSSDRGQRRREETLIERYGSDNLQKIPKFKEKTKLTNLKKYGVSNPMQCPIIREKATNTCMEKYGVSNPSKIPEVKEKQQKTMERIYGRRFVTQIHLSQNVVDTLNCPDTLKRLHREECYPLSHIANMLGVDTSTVSYNFDKLNIEKKRFKKSSGELHLGKFLTDNNIDFSQRNRNIISTELDFYIEPLNLAIEYHGVYWHSDARFKDTNVHYNKWKECNEKGIRLIQIFEDEWINNRPIVENKILHICGLNTSNRIYARKCKIVNLTKKEKKAFFNANHIQGDGHSSVNYGLVFDGNLVAAMGLKKSGDGYIINRYATNSNVIGGFSKILSSFEKEFNHPQITTFADLRWDTGNLYLSNGFTLDKELPPDYYWVKGISRWHKFNWRHTSGLKKLKNYNPNLSETENMKSHGFHKLWDSGKIRFTKNM